MFSAGKMSGSAGEAARYYTRGDYYERGSTEPGTWGGTGSEQLGLSGPVDKKDLEKVLGGDLGPAERTAWDGKQPSGERTTGYDFTFSPPKSVSIMALVAGDHRIIELQKEAAAAGMAYIEKHAAVRVRTPETGIETKPTGNLLYASFTETTSRELDPQLHTHNPIASATYDRDREGWYAVHWKETMKALKAADKVALAHMAVGLQRLGYSLDVDQEKGSFEIAGQDPKLLEGMSKASHRVAKWLENHPNATMTDYLKRKSIDRPDKQSSTRDLHESKWRDEVREGYEKGDWSNSPQELDKMRDAAIARPVELDRVDAAMALRYAIQKHVGREAVVAEKQIVESALSFGMGKVDRDTLGREIAEQVKNGDLIRPTEKTGDRPLLHPITTKEMYRLERDFHREMKRGAGRVSMLMAPSDADKALNRFRIESNGEKFPLNDDQKAAAKLVLTTNDRFSVIQGTAGAGKSELVAAVMQATPKRTHLGVAPTGQALKELEGKTGIKTMTVQRLVLTGAKEVMRGTIVFADEASMNDSRIATKMAKLARMRGFRLITIGDRDQLPAIGAGRPHEESLEAAASIAKLDRSMRQREGSQAALVAATVKAGQTWQRAGLVAPELRSGPRGDNPFTYLPTVLGDGLKEFSAGDGEVDRNTIALAAAKSYVADGSDKKGPVLVLDNKVRTLINKQVRKLLVKEGHLSDERSRVATVLVPQRRDEADKAHSFSYKSGDILVFNLGASRHGIEKGEKFEIQRINERGMLEMQSLDRGRVRRTIGIDRANSKALGIFRPEKRKIAIGDRIATTAKMGEIANATSGKVTHLSESHATLNDDKGKATKLDLTKDQQWDHAYAMTFQKAQGATMDHARVVLLSSDAQMASAKTLNSAVTRARETVELYTDDAKSAIGKIAGSAGMKTSAREAIGREIAEPTFKEKAQRFLEKATDRARQATRILSKGRLEYHAEVPDWGMRHVQGERYQLTDEQTDLREKEIEDLKAKGAPEQEYRSPTLAEIKEQIAQVAQDLAQEVTRTQTQER